MTNQDLETALAEWAQRNGATYLQREGNGVTYHSVKLEGSCSSIEARLLADGRARVRCGFELIASHSVDSITSWLNGLANNGVNQ